MAYELLDSFVKIDFYLEISLIAAVLIAVLERKKYPKPAFVCAAAAELFLLGGLLHVMPEYFLDTRAAYMRSDDFYVRMMTSVFALSFVFFVQLCLLAVTIRITTRFSWQLSLYVMFLAYLVEHTANSLWIVFAMWDYQRWKELILGTSVVVHQLPPPVSYALVLVLEVYLLHKGSRDSEAFLLGVHQYMPMLGVLLVFGLILNTAAKLCFMKIQENALLVGVCVVYDILCSFFVLWVQYATIDKNYFAQEAEFERMLRRQRAQHYTAFKTNLDMINGKCHRLKHQVRTLRESMRDEETCGGNRRREDMCRKSGADWLDETLSRLERELALYNAIVSTGNEVIDVAVNEKSLVCEKEGITLTCMIDGRMFTRMEPMEVYQLFGDALELAIQKAKRQQDADRRIISIVQSVQGNIRCVHFECYGDRDAQDEVLLTSMNRIAARWGGSIGVSCAEQIWTLKLVF